jgi:hypothetical protein
MGLGPPTRPVLPAADSGWRLCQTATRRPVRPSVGGWSQSASPYSPPLVGGVDPKGTSGQRWSARCADESLIRVRPEQVLRGDSGSQGGIAIPALTPGGHQLDGLAESGVDAGRLIGHRPVFQRWVPATRRLSAASGATELHAGPTAASKNQELPARLLRWMQRARHHIIAVPKLRARHCHVRWSRRD